MRISSKIPQPPLYCIQKILKSFLYVINNREVRQISVFFLRLLSKKPPPAPNSPQPLFKHASLRPCCWFSKQDVDSTLSHFVFLKRNFIFGYVMNTLIHACISISFSIRLLRVILSFLANRYITSLLLSIIGELIF